MGKKVVFSGIQPTGDIHLGNYIGAVSSWVEMQNLENTKNIYCIVDLHAITAKVDPNLLSENILSLLAWLVASGISNKKSTLFIQSSNPNHAQLGWILGCIARIGWLNRMTQFKDKAGKDKEKSSVGLYTYPVLQAADILLYNTTTVPVGEDQKQHIELARDIAIKFNREVKDLFVVPDVQISKDSARIMSFRDATKKMSKSDPSEASKILLSDSNDQILKKTMKAVTDSSNMPETIDDLSNRLAVKNLVSIYAFCTKQEISNVVKNYANADFSTFKKDLADALISLIEPIRNNYLDLIQNKDYLINIMKEGKEQSIRLSESTLEKVKKAVGFIL